MKDVCPNDFEAFPILLKTANGDITGYYLINVSNYIKDGYDKEHSECFDRFTTIPNDNVTMGGLEFDRLILNKGCMGDRHISRFYERADIIVSSTLIREFEHAEVTGFKYELYENRVNGRWSKNFASDGQLKY